MRIIRAKAITTYPIKRVEGGTVSMEDMIILKTCQRGLNCKGGNGSDLFRRGGHQKGRWLDVRGRGRMRASPRKNAGAARFGINLLSYKKRINGRGPRTFQKTK